MCLMFFEDTPWNRGDTLTLCSAVVYALYILGLEAAARRHQAAPLRATRMAASLAGSMWTCTTLMLWLQPQGFERLQTQAQALPPGAWLAIAYLGLVASALALLLATTASFAQTVRNLHPQFNVVLFDQPYAGKSKPHNRHERLISKETEAHILLELIEHFQADHVMSFSWGGACTLLAVAHQPAWPAAPFLLLRFAAQFVGHLRGGLGYANVG